VHVRRRTFDAATVGDDLDAEVVEPIAASRDDAQQNDAGCK
jgi:hypothetical protein